MLALNTPMSRRMKKREGSLAKAIAEAGSISALALKLRLSPQAVAQWRQVPPERVIDVEKITGVSRHHLRPDIFGRVPTKSSAATAAV
jgi:DNA-binding transcriptional regulator YdaS (Cro superfamily)